MMTSIYWTEMSYRKFESRPQFNRYDYEAWDLDIDDNENRIDYDEIKED